MTISPRSSLADVAAAVAAVLETAGIDAVLTGGACATLHTHGRYQSRDLDFIVRAGGTRQALDAAMTSIGFRREGDQYTHPSTSLFVEFPRGPLAIGDDLRIEPVELEVGRGRVRALSATDACRDRLAAFYHWSDRQSLEVAVEVALANRVRLGAIERWSRAEGFREKFAEFRRQLAGRRRK